MSESVQPEWKPEHPLLLDQRQAAALLGVSDRTIRRLIRARKLKVRFLDTGERRKEQRKARPKPMIPYAEVERFARKVAG